jgi:hypothetical protein
MEVPQYAKLPVKSRPADSLTGYGWPFLFFLPGDRFSFRAVFRAKPARLTSSLLPQKETNGKGNE